MVAGTLRHLRSIRRFQPDQGWVKTLLEESYNERMHLLTFLELYKPGPLMRLFVFAAQGVFYNAMFVSYLVSPKICHRFVGYLEEEAVHTYTRCLREIDEGRLPGWAVTSGGGGKKVPDVAVQYWGMGEGRRTMRDLILYIRVSDNSLFPSRLMFLFPCAGCSHIPRQRLTHRVLHWRFAGRRSISSRGQPHPRQPPPDVGPQPLHRRVQPHGPEADLGDETGRVGKGGGHHPAPLLREGSSAFCYCSGHVLFPSQFRIQLLDAMLPFFRFSYLAL